MAEQVDFEAEGLAAGLEGDERGVRLELLAELHSDGFSLEQLSTAVAQGRLALLRVEREIAGDGLYTPDELARLSGVPREMLDTQWRALGMTVDDDAATLTERDLEAAQRVSQFIAAGLAPEAIVEMTRVLAVTMSQFAAANRQTVASAFADVADTELDVSRRFRAVAQALIPMVGPTLEYVYRLQLSEQLRHVVVGAGIDGSETVAIAFADLVGYTKLGEQLPPEELGRVTGRLDEIALEVAGGPVRLVKLIGDAAMLVSADTGVLIDAMLDLVDAAEEEGEGFPAIRAGIARGPVTPRGGDYFGRPVNLASRITGLARPGSLLVSGEVREEVAELYRFSDAGHKPLKGVEHPVHLYRCRDLEPDEDGPEPPAGEATSPAPAAELRGRRARRRRHVRRSEQRHP